MKVINKCGGKKTGCTVEFDLPYGYAPKHVNDNKVNPQGEAGMNKPKTKPKYKTKTK